MRDKNKSFAFVCDTIIRELENANDPNGICLDFVSYTQAMDEASKIYFTTNKLAPSANRSPLSAT